MNMEKAREHTSGLVAKIKNHGAALVAAAALANGGYACDYSRDYTDTLVVQYDGSGTPLTCWEVSESKLYHRYEPGICWEQGDGMACATGTVMTLPVSNGNWEEAARALGIELGRCTNGRYQNE